MILRYTLCRNNYNNNHTVSSAGHLLSQKVSLNESAQSSDGVDQQVLVTNLNRGFSTVSETRRNRSAP